MKTVTLTVAEYAQIMCINNAARNVVRVWCVQQQAQVPGSRSSNATPAANAPPRVVELKAKHALISAVKAAGATPAV